MLRIVARFKGEDMALSLELDALSGNLRSLLTAGHLGHCVSAESPVIDDEAPLLLSVPVSGDSAAVTQGRSTSAPSSPIKGTFKGNLMFSSIVESLERGIHLVR